MGDVRVLHLPRLSIAHALEPEKVGSGAMPYAEVAQGEVAGPHVMMSCTPPSAYMCTYYSQPLITPMEVDAALYMNMRRACLLFLFFEYVLGLLID